MTIINYGYDAAAEHEIRITLQLQEDGRSLLIDVVDDRREFNPLAVEPEPDVEAFLEDRVEGAAVAVRLMREFVDQIGNRRRNCCNHLTLQKGVRS